MTTFHELLGTTATDSLDVVKQRYRLLSHRVHPDKEGTPALMLLIRHAYEKIKAGKGNEPLLWVTHETALARQTLENTKLQQQNTMLASRLKQLEQREQQNYQAIKTLQQYEKQLSLLKNERRHLLLRKEAEQSEKLKLAKELKRVLLEQQLSKGPSVEPRPQHKWVGYIALCLAVICLVLIAGQRLFNL